MACGGFGSVDCVLTVRYGHRQSPRSIRHTRARQGNRLRKATSWEEEDESGWRGWAGSNATSWSLLHTLRLLERQVEKIKGDEKKLIRGPNFILPEPIAHSHSHSHCPFALPIRLLINHSSRMIHSSRMPVADEGWMRRWGTRPMAGGAGRHSSL